MGLVHLADAPRIKGSNHPHPERMPEWRRQAVSSMQTDRCKQLISVAPTNEMRIIAVPGFSAFYPSAKPRRVRGQSFLHIPSFMLRKRILVGLMDIRISCFLVIVQIRILEAHCECSAETVYHSGTSHPLILLLQGPRQSTRPLG